MHDAHGCAAPEGPPMFAKKMFYVSASLFMLALAYHLGASTATAQAPSNSVVAIGPDNGVYTANGDIYYGGGGAGGHWARTGNVFTNAQPTATQTQSFGALKAKYR